MIGFWLTFEKNSLMFSINISIKGNVLKIHTYQDRGT